jgi:hypothetical protein
MKTDGRLLLKCAFVTALCLDLLALAGPARAASTTLVINEIDYDQVGTDTAEFLELKNVSSSPINLSGYTIVLVNGANGQTYQTFDLPNVDLAAAGHFVLCGNSANTLICDLDVSPDSDLIQNGSPDAAALFHDGVLVDTVSYEGNTVAPYTEGTGTAAADSNTTPEVGLSAPGGS